MEPISIIEFLSLCLNIAKCAWALYVAWKRGHSTAEIKALHAELDQAVSGLKLAMTPKELDDAATHLAQSHRDILK